ncbi:MAG TPA: LUD domain-containing protein [Bacilli bacterium]
MSSPNTGKIHGQGAFINNISSRLGRKQPLTSAPDHPTRGVPDFYKDIALSKHEQIDVFTKNWTALTGKVLVVKEAEAQEAIAAWLLEVCSELGVTKVVRYENEQIRQLGLDAGLEHAGIHVVPWKEREAYAFPEEEVAPDSNWSSRSPLLQSAERCKLGIVWPDYAIANTSTLVIEAQGGHGRSVSLVTEVLFAIFRADQLVTRMGEALEPIYQAAASDPGELASSINMITGPSRSADIENDLTIGIHGPGKVYAVIIE